MALTGFFDETGTHQGHPIIGVAGFLYDDAGIDQFRTAWACRTSELATPFHTADCYFGSKQFSGWPHPVRMLLMHDLADLIARTKLAGITVFIERLEWEQWAKLNQKEIVASVGSAYSACLLRCMSIARDVSRAKFDSASVHYVFEAGSEHQSEAETFLYHAGRNARTVEDLLLRGHSFERKSAEPALCAADFLAWEWQRNYVETLQQAEGAKGQWRSEFQILLKSQNMYFRALSGDALSVRAIINLWNEKSQRLEEPE